MKNRKEQRILSTVKDFDNLALKRGGLPFIQLMANSLKLKRGMKVLDIGCGMGYTSIFVGKSYQVEVIAHDLWSSPTEVFETIEQHEAKNEVIPIHGDPFHLPFADGYFDAIYSADYLAYSQSSTNYISYLLRFLKPAGKLCIGGPVLDKFSEQSSDIKGSYPQLYTETWWREHFGNLKGANISYQTTIHRFDSALTQSKNKELEVDDEGLNHLKIVTMEKHKKAITY